MSSFNAYSNVISHRGRPQQASGYGIKMQTGSSNSDISKNEEKGRSGQPNSEDLSGRLSSNPEDDLKMIRERITQLEHEKPEELSYNKIISDSREWRRLEQEMKLLEEQEKKEKNPQKAKEKVEEEEDLSFVLGKKRMDSKVRLEKVNESVRAF
jgi:hypothetical protein